MGGPSTKVMSETQLLDSRETQIPSISQFRGCQPASASEWPEDSGLGNRPWLGSPLAGLWKPSQVFNKQPDSEKFGIYHFVIFSDILFFFEI